MLLLSALAFVCHAKTFRCEISSDGSCEDNCEQRPSNMVDMQFTYFADCEDALKKGFSKRGVYRIKPAASFRPFNVWCDMGSEGGGWTVIQNRFDGLVGFYRTWKEYRNGFGSVDSEHWLGNNFIHQLTVNNDYELKIELTGFETNEFASAKYSPFRIGSEDEKYKLYVGSFTPNGAIKDNLSLHNGHMFTAKDNDNDITTGNCADAAQGGWWYHKCYQSNLNGIWMSKERSIATKGAKTNDNVIGIVWNYVFNSSAFYSLKSVEMKVRRIR